MRPTRYEALRRAVGIVMGPSDDEWDEIDNRMEVIRGER